MYPPSAAIPARPPSTRPASSAADVLTDVGAPCPAHTEKARQRSLPGRSVYVSLFSGGEFVLQHLQDTFLADEDDETAETRPPLLAENDLIEAPKDVLRLGAGLPRHVGGDADHDEQRRGPE